MGRRTKIHSHRGAKKHKSRKSKKISNIDNSVVDELNTKMLSVIDPQDLEDLYNSNKNFRRIFDKWQGKHYF